MYKKKKNPNKLEPQSNTTEGLNLISTLQVACVAGGIRERASGGAAIFHCGPPGNSRAANSKLQFLSCYFQLEISLVYLWLLLIQPMMSALTSTSVQLSQVCDEEP